MALVTATTAFLLNREMWSAGDCKEVTPNVATELLQAGLVMRTEEAAETPVALPPVDNPTRKRKQQGVK